MTHDESLTEGLLRAYGPVIRIENIGPDFEARGAGGTDGFTLLHKICGNKVAHFGEEATPEAIVAAQNNHECPAQSAGAGVA